MWAVAQSYGFKGTRWLVVYFLVLLHLLPRGAGYAEEADLGFPGRGGGREGDRRAGIGQVRAMCCGGHLG